nr:MAG TPA: hypothetical protein [Myoviridae sp. ctNPX13]
MYWYISYIPIAPLAAMCGYGYLYTTILKTTPSTEEPTLLR